MRLTLRNLLRFLDQADLRSIERSRLEELVDESEKADAWIERIDRLRRDAKLAAPAVGSTDPEINTVAAYLASDMSEEQTIEFERSMLASDQLLAEVASCHEIRELLHAENPPAISILLRQSIYDLDRNGLEEGQVTARPADATAAMPAAMEDLPFVDSQPGKRPDVSDAADELPESKPVSLDDLADQAKKKSQLVTASLLFIAAALLGLTYWLGWMAGRYPGEIAGVAERSTERVDPGETSDPGPQPEDPDADPTTPEEPTDPGTETDPGDEVANQLQPVPPPVEENATPPVDTNALPQQPDIASVQIVAPPEPEAVLPPQQVAVLVQPDALLFVRDAATNVWRRVADDTRLLEMSELLMLAGSSVRLDIGDHVALTVDGPARFSLGRRDKASGADVLQVLYGGYKATAKDSDVDILVDHRGERFRVTMPVKDASVAARFGNWFAPGNDPRSDSAAHMLMFVVDSGRATIAQGDQSWPLTQSNALTRIDSANPDWQRPFATGIPARPLDIPRYLTRLENVVMRNQSDLVPDDGPLRDQLADLKSNARQELRFAAISWLAATGHYSYLVDFLSEASNRANWHSLIDAVRASIVAQPEFAEALFADLAVAGVENQSKLYDLFRGTDATSLTTGADARLVELLGDENLAVRVLAIDNMRQITGGITYNYAPQAPRADRRRIIERQWQRALRKGEIRYSEPPRLPEIEFAGAAVQDPESATDEPVPAPAAEDSGESGDGDSN